VPDVAALPANIRVHRVAPQAHNVHIGVAAVVARRGEVELRQHIRRNVITMWRLGVPTLTLQHGLGRVDVTSVG